MSDNTNKVSYVELTNQPGMIFNLYVIQFLKLYVCILCCWSTSFEQ